MRFLLFSDLHLLKNPKDVYKDIASQWIEWVTGIITSQKIDGIFFLGDWHDNNKQLSIDEIQFSFQCMQRLKEVCNVIHIVPGNHDCFFKNNCSVNSVAHFASSKIHVHEKTTVVSYDGYSFVFVPWGGNLEKGMVMLGHFDIQGFSMDNGKKADHGYTGTELLKHSPLIFSGHYHHAQKKTYKNGTIQYLGSPFQLNFGESGKQSYVWILDTVGCDIGVTYRKMENTFSPQYYTVSSLDELENKEGNFIRVTDSALMESIPIEKYLTVKPFSHTTASLENVLTEKVHIDFDIDFPEIVDQLVRTEVPENYQEGTRNKLISYYNELK